MRKPAPPLWCPLCNANGNAQPILTGLVLDYLPTSQIVRDSKPRYKGEWENPQFKYKCIRCGYSEIHVAPQPPSKPAKPA